MENFIKNLRISNFKSIREAELSCGRINLFVGKPNVGKSNLLEALSLLGAPFNSSSKFLSDFIRYERVKNLFSFSKTEVPILVDSEIGGAILFHDYQSDTSELFIGPPSAIHHMQKERLNRDDFRNRFKDSKGSLKPGVVSHIQDNGKSQGFFGDSYSPVKKYSFDPKQSIDKRDRSFLLPPYGTNLFAVLESTQRLKEEIPELFEEYGYEFLIDDETSSFYLLKREKRIGYKIPYSLVADTLQRIIFHYAAIFSNKESVILFEEPESHSFPPYVKELALKIVESTENQFFITTHSPHLFTTIVEETEPADLAVFITYFENYETKFKKLDTDDINDILNGGVNIFFNQKWFLNEENTPSFA